MRAEERAENLLIAIDKVVPVIDRQIERYKGKYNRKGKTGPSIKAKLNEEPAPEVVSTKRFTMKPMSVEDAMMQMELLGHDFFLFYNSDPRNIISFTGGKTAITVSSNRS